MPLEGGIGFWYRVATHLFHGGVAIPVGTFEYRDEAEKAAIEQHIAFVHQMRDLAVSVPHGHVLDRLEGHALTVVRLYLENARKAITAQQKLCDRLDGLSQTLAWADVVSPDQYLRTVEATIMAENHFNLPADEHAANLAHWAMFRPADMEAVQNEWSVLIRKLQAAMDAGLDPKSAEV